MRRLLGLVLLLVACGPAPSFERSAPFKPGVLAIHLARTTPADGYRQATVVSSTDVIYLNPLAELTEAHLQKVSVVDGPNDEKHVLLKFNEEGAARMTRLTAANLNQRLALLIDGQVVMAPVVSSRIDGGEAMLTSGYTQEEAERLVMRLSGS
jgi:preprotein translocase subunit SecD